MDILGSHACLLSISIWLWVRLVVLTGGEETPEGILLQPPVLPTGLKLGELEPDPDLGVLDSRDTSDRGTARLASTWNMKIIIFFVKPEWRRWRACFEKKKCREWLMKATLLTIPNLSFINRMRLVSECIVNGMNVCESDEPEPPGSPRHGVLHHHCILNCAIHSKIFPELVYMILVLSCQ